MKVIKLPSLVGLIVIFAFACNQPAQQTPNSAPIARPESAATTATPNEFAAASMTFAKECVNCHTAKGEGGEVTVDGQKLKVPSLREGHALDHPDSEFVEQITGGGDGMPAFKGKLKPEEIEGLVRFIRHEFQGGRTPPAEHMKPAKGPSK